MNIIFNLLNEVLNYSFSFTKDWGLAIVLLTIFAKIVILPMSIKQKKSMLAQQEISSKMNEIKEKYKGNEKKIQDEMTKQYSQSAKSMMGWLISFLQLPIVMTVFNVVRNLPVEAPTIIIPWVASIKMSDGYYIVPLIYTMVSLMPNFIYDIGYLKVLKQTTFSKQNVIIMGFISLLITIKAPVALVIYFITSSLFSMLEDFFFRIYIKYSKSYA